MKTKGDTKKPPVKPPASDDGRADAHTQRRGGAERAPGTIRSGPDHVLERGPDSGGGKLRPSDR